VRTPGACLVTLGGDVGDRAARPDARDKVTGAFHYTCDVAAPDMLWGGALRSPHPHAEISAIDTAAARALPGVAAVLTAADLDSRPTFGLINSDQPVLADDRVRCHGEPVALVAAEDRVTLERALGAIAVDYHVVPALVSPERALADGAPALHPGGNLLRHVRIRRGELPSRAPVVVRGTYELGMQDPLFLAPEACLAEPLADGGVRLTAATQNLHSDRDQLAAIMGLAPDDVHVELGGVGGAFGGREDLSVQAHACLLARHTGRPVKICLSRQESFLAHMRRHPARLEYEHGAAADGLLRYVLADILFDGGAYSSSSMFVVANAACFAVGPYEVPAVSIDARVAYTNNPPCGAMRGFGAVQTCFAYEAQMDRLAAAVGLSPLEVRRRNAMRPGSSLPTGQQLGGPVPVAELLACVDDAPLPPIEPRAAHVRRGVGYAVGFKNVCFSEGHDDHATASVRLSLGDNGEPMARVRTAAAEVGQGLVTVLGQIVRTELGVAHVAIHPADTSIETAGGASASRQTLMSGGAVYGACREIRGRLLERLSHTLDVTRPFEFNDGWIVDEHGQRVTSLTDVLSDGPVERLYTHHHRQTSGLDPETGQGDAFVDFAFAAQRAIVDVDIELGTVQVIEVVAAQDVGRAINPLAVEGQIQGGVAQGLGLALLEEVEVCDGVIHNTSLANYLVPNAVDVPAIRPIVLEMPHDDAPYGLTGVGEPPTIASTAAIAAAVRAATGTPVARVPIDPNELARPTTDASRSLPGTTSLRSGPAIHRPHGDEAVRDAG